MGRNRFVEIEGRGWFEVGTKLASVVADKSSFAYEFDRKVYADEPEIRSLWSEVGKLAEVSMQRLTPNAYDLCRGFQTIFTLNGDGFSVWELLTLYEVDMFLHEFHYKCHMCKRRIMNPPRHICLECAPRSGPDSPVTGQKKGKRPTSYSVCADCFTKERNCAYCSSQLTSTDVLYETSGVGIANKSGCTGFGYRDDSVFICGQTLEMATDTYNYGRFDTIYKLRNLESGITVLVYDVGCILSPFGINSRGLALCVFNLYNSDYCLPPYEKTDRRVPMAALQWEVLLSGLGSVPESLTFLRSANGGIPTFTSASFIVSAKGECSVIEVSANRYWIPDRTGGEHEDDQPAAVQSGPVPNSKWIVRANNCLAGSSLRDHESLPPNISSRERQANLAESFVGLGNQTPSLSWAKAALSTLTIQTEYCLGTILMDPANLSMHVRFRVGTRISSTLKDGGIWDVFRI